MTQAPATAPEQPATEEPTQQQGGSIANALRAMEIDTRLLGMLAALLVIWVGFHIWSGGTFITPRNLWNLSVQTAAVATGITADGGISNSHV